VVQASHLPALLETFCNTDWQRRQAGRLHHRGTHLRLRTKDAKIQRLFAQVSCTTFCRSPPLPHVSKILEVPSTSAGRIDRIVQELTGKTRAEVRGLFDHGCVTLNDELCELPGETVSEGDEVVVKYDSHRRYHEKSRDDAPAAGRMFRIVHEDEDLIVIDKSAGVLTVPAVAGDKQTLVHALSTYLSRGQRRTLRVEIVHRLDRDVSGLLVFAKNMRTAKFLEEQFAAHTPLREYVAIVAGMITEPVGTFRSKLTTGKDLRRYSTNNPEEGESAVTHFRTIETARGATLVRVKLETGRRNQIRVHFAECGHPVLGDPRYQPKLAEHPDWNGRRIALHAQVLGFHHPGTRQDMGFESPAPNEFVKFLGHKLR